MSNDIWVSIIVPSFNKGQFIEETILSIINQSYDKIELIVIDAESTDGTHSILEKYSGSIAKCVIEPDKGQSDAINKGASLAKGEILGWLNADDLLYPDAILSIVEGFKSYPEVGAVYGGGMKIDIVGNDIKDIPHRPFDRKLLQQLFYILQPSMYFRKDIFQKVGGLNVDSHLAMDWELVLKMLKVTELAAISEKIAKLRMYEGTKTSGGGWETYREIARIGKDQNGITDVNYLAFVLRTLVSRTRLPFIDNQLRVLVDKLCDYLAGGELYMVCQWPEAFDGKDDNEKAH